MTIEYTELDGISLPVDDEIHRTVETTLFPSIHEILSQDVTRLFSVDGETVTLNVYAVVYQRQFMVWWGFGEGIKTARIRTETVARRLFPKLQSLRFIS